MHRADAAFIFAWMARMALQPPPLEELVPAFTALLTERSSADEVYAILSLIQSPQCEPLLLPSSPLYLDDISEAGGIIRCSLTPRIQPASALLLNLIARELPIGIVVAEKRKPMTFTAAEIALLDTICRRFGDVCYVSLRRNGSIKRRK